MTIYTDELINKLDPQEQISGIISHNDQISEAEKALIAQKVGQNLGISGANGADGASLVRFVDATYNAFTEGDVHRYIYISGSSNGNDGFKRIAKFISSSEVELATALTATETGLAWSMYREPNLEDDINIALTQLREIIDPANPYFQDMPRSFDPTNTDGSNTKNEKISMKVLADNWYGSKSKILDVATSEVAVSNGNTGVLYASALSYADPANREGLVIQSSVANVGSYQDEVALASITLGRHKVTLLDPETGTEFKDASGNLIFGVLQDATDHSGTGEGTDVYIKFVYDNAGVPTNYTWTATDPANIVAYMPQRKRRSNLLEHDERRVLISSLTGDAEIAEDINNLQSALGIADSETNWDLTNLTNFFPFSELGLNPTMEDVVNKLNEEIGDRTYTSSYLTDGQSITDSLNALGNGLEGAGIKSKILEDVTATISAGTVHTIPFASGTDPLITSYKLDTTDNGLYLDIFVNGKKIAPDSATINREYGETSGTQVTFRFNIKKGAVIEYIIRDDA